jgi:transcriptional regulator with GAF, ATPase, and Fis domain
MALDPDEEATLVLTEEERTERARIIVALSVSDKNTIRAAESLGLSLRTLRGKIERYRIPRKLAANWPWGPAC